MHLGQEGFNLCFMKKSFLIPTLALMLAGCTPKEMTTEQLVDALYNRMTPEERLAQLQGTYLHEFFTEDGQLDTTLCRQRLANGIGHFSQYASQMGDDPNVIRDKVAAMQEWLMNNTPTGIPALFHEEVLTGVCTRYATQYPQQIGYACSFNTELAELKALQTGIAMRKMGGLLSLSPMVDVCRVPSFNRLEESYGEDGYVNAAFGTAFVRGLQQGDLKKGVGTCSKHYLGYGGGGDADEKTLMEEILLPHETMIRVAGSKVVMPGYHWFHGKHCAGSEEMLEGILRQYVGFDGMVVSDYTAIDQISECEDDLHRAAAAINAGTDVDFPRGAMYTHLPEAMEKGLVSEETFARAVKRVLTYKARVGMFDENPYFYSKEHIVFDTPEERQTAYDLASQSIVLLQNNGILPLNNTLNSKLSTLNSVFLTGPNANTIWSMMGDYTYQAMRYFWQMKTEDGLSPKIVNLKEGLESKLPEGMKLTYSRGCDWTEVTETWLEEGGDQRVDWMRYLLDRKMPQPDEINTAEALKMAKQADVIIAAMGENVMLCGENRERPTLRLPGRQEEYVEQLLATGKPVILVVFGGRPQVISKLADRCAAVIQAWYPGEEGGNAVADILLGNVSPSAKLSISYPNQEIKDEAICYNTSLSADPRIAWPFGYGLSYTTFEYANISADASAATSDKVINLSFDVKNTGNMQADEIAQIYISPAEGQSLKPIALQGFGRVSLAPGETKKLSFALNVEQFGFYADGHWNIAPGKYLVKIGASSQNILLEQEVTLTGDVFTKPLRDTYFSVQI